MDIFNRLAEMPHAYIWLIFAAILGIGEIIVPGVFLIWIALAAAITGVLTLAVGLLPALQFGLFGILCIAAVYLGRKWYLERGASVEDPLLNDRSARMVGQSVMVTEDVNEYEGRARVGDSEWPARGNSIKKGQSAKIIEVKDGIIHIAAI